MLRGFVVVATLGAVAGRAEAFQIESPVSGGCHEAITLAAQTRTGFPDHATAPMPTEDQRRAMNDLTFTLPADRRDVWSMTFVMGVRSNDLHDAALSDLAALIHIHDDPEDQPAHCLRKREDDGGPGDVAALANCRAFILGELEAGGLFADTIDMTTTEKVAVFLAFRGRVEIELPRYAWHLGKAVHALEDGYAHTLRDPVTGHVRSVLNWIDYITSDDYDSARDGYHHLSVIDDCRRDSPYEVLRVQHATDAVSALLGAVGDPLGGEGGRRARVSAALDQYLFLDPGCDASNRWCNAEELEEEAAGCNASGAPTFAPLGCVLLLLALRRRRAPARIVLVLVLVLVLDHSASAGTHAYLDARTGGALDRTALAFSGGGGLTAGSWSGGLVVEWNPWFSFDAGRAEVGALNTYATVAHRWYDGHCFQLYSRAEVGASTILFELVGVDRYHTGLYVGGSLLGVAWKRGEHWRLTFDPSHFAMPTPQISGVPFYYRQYRITLGAEYQF